MDAIQNEMLQMQQRMLLQSRQMVDSIDRDMLQLQQDTQRDVVDFQARSTGYSYRWEKSSPQYHVSQSYTVWRSDVPHHPQPTLGSVALVAALAVAALYAALAAAFQRGFSKTRYAEEHKWKLVLLSPVLLLFNATFRQEFWKALRANRESDDKAESGAADAAGGQQI